MPSHLSRQCCLFCCPCHGFHLVAHRPTHRACSQRSQRTTLPLWAAYGRNAPVLPVAPHPCSLHVTSPYARGAHTRTARVLRYMDTEWSNGLLLLSAIPAVIPGELTIRLYRHPTWLILLALGKQPRLQQPLCKCFGRQAPAQPASRPKNTTREGTMPSFRLLAPPSATSCSCHCLFPTNPNPILTPHCRLFPTLAPTPPGSRPRPNARKYCPPAGLLLLLLLPLVLLLPLD